MAGQTRPRQSCVGTAQRPPNMKATPSSAGYQPAVSQTFSLLGARSLPRQARWARLPANSRRYSRLTVCVTGLPNTKQRLAEWQAKRDRVKAALERLKGPQT